jgi:hypothetical protein
MTWLFTILTHWVAFGLGFVLGALIFASRTDLDDDEWRHD